MKISLCFTHPWSILGVYDFLLSDESNRSYITVQKTWKKVLASVIKRPSHGSGGWIKASCSESMRICKINIHITNVINTFFSLPLTVVRGSHAGGFATGGLYSPPRAVWGTFYYGCEHFLSRLLNCWRQTPAYPIKRLGGARTIFNITPIGLVWKKKVTYT